LLDSLFNIPHYKWENKTQNEDTKNLNKLFSSICNRFQWGAADPVGIYISSRGPVIFAFTTLFVDNDTAEKMKAKIKTKIYDETENNANQSTTKSSSPSSSAPSTSPRHHSSFKFMLVHPQSFKNPDGNIYDYSTPSVTTTNIQFWRLVIIFSESKSYSHIVNCLQILQKWYILYNFVFYLRWKYTIHSNFFNVKLKTTQPLSVYINNNIKLQEKDGIPDFDSFSSIIKEAYLKLQQFQTILLCIPEGLFNVPVTNYGEHVNVFTEVYSHEGWYILIRIISPDTQSTSAAYAAIIGSTLQIWESVGINAEMDKIFTTSNSNKRTSILVLDPKYEITSDIKTPSVRTQFNGKWVYWK
jgi:hypothetical protein